MRKITDSERVISEINRKARSKGMSYDKEERNCHGCKWLDEVKSQPAGSGYCCYVVYSRIQQEKARYSSMERCELYEKGNFATRYQR